MSTLSFILDRYKIQPDQVRFWDETNSRFNAAINVNTTTVLAEHQTPKSWIGVLTHWQQYYRPLPTPASPTPGDLHFLNDSAGTFWRLSKNGQAIPGLNLIQQITNPWGSDIYPPDGAAFYMSEFGAAGTLWQLLFRTGAALPAETFELGGRIIGFDFPVSFLDKSQTPPPRP